ncbi:MAG: hypothetical protein AB7V39_27785 [Nitrospiraceae bacterium]
MDDIFKRRALRLKQELSEAGGPSSSFFSTIYPATDYEKAMPPTVKTPSSIPSSNDAKAVTTADGREKGEKEKDEPGPSKTTSASLRVVPGETAMVPPAHKQTAFALGNFGEDRSAQFVKNCVSIITGVKKLEHEGSSAGQDVDVAEPEKPCSCGGTCVPCKKAQMGRVGHDHSKLSELAKKFAEPKKTYG